MILAKKGGDQNLNEASKLIENALAILPDNPALYDTSASIDEGKHQYASAVTHMTEAVNREPGKPSYIVHLARCLFESQNTQEAADELDKFDSINQEQPNSISPDLLQQAAVLRSKLPSSPHAS
jgi:predicted Zn-dependent protease